MIDMRDWEYNHDPDDDQLCIECGDLLMCDEEVLCDDCRWYEHCEEEADDRPL